MNLQLEGKFISKKWRELQNIVFYYILIKNNAQLVLIKKINIEM